MYLNTQFCRAFVVQTTHRTALSHPKYIRDLTTSTHQQVFNEVAG